MVFKHLLQSSVNINDLQFASVLVIVLSDNRCEAYDAYCKTYFRQLQNFGNTVKILKFGTPQTIAIIVLKIEKFDVTLH